MKTINPDKARAKAIRQGRALNSAMLIAIRADNLAKKTGKRRAIDRELFAALTQTVLKLRGSMKWKYDGDEVDRFVQALRECMMTDEEEGGGLVSVHSTGKSISLSGRFNLKALSKRLLW